MAALATGTDAKLQAPVDRDSLHPVGYFQRRELDGRQTAIAISCLHHVYTKFSALSADTCGHQCTTTRNYMLDFPQSFPRTSCCWMPAEADWTKWGAGGRRFESSRTDQWNMMKEIKGLRKRSPFFLLGAQGRSARPDGTFLLALLFSPGISAVPCYIPRIFQHSNSGIITSPNFGVKTWDNENDEKTSTGSRLRNAVVGMRDPDHAALFDPG
jgi:hypothetical protein